MTHMKSEPITEQQSVLTPRQAARYLGISQALLRCWRWRNEGPPFFRAGSKLVRYRRDDLDFWIQSRLSEPCASALQVDGERIATVDDRKLAAPVREARSLITTAART